MSEKWFAGLGALALGALAACGGSESSSPKQRSMVPSQPAAVAKGENRAPVLTDVRLDPEQPGPGDSVEARAVAQDPDGTPFELRYRWRVNGREVAVSGPTLPGGSVGRDDRIEVSVVATDGLLESEERRARATVVARTPEMASVSFDAPENAKPGDEITALVDATGADDAALRLEYRWLVNGEVTRQRERTFSTAGLRRGDRVQVKVRARDGDSASGVLTSEELVLGNSPPEIAGIPKAEREGDAFRYRFEAEDPDGDRSLRWSLAEAPAGMTIDPIYGVATWRPGKEQAGTHTIEVQVSDNHGDGSSLRFQVTATVSEKTAQGDAQPAAPAPAAPLRDDS
jgi:hypothetical protein